MNRRKIAEAPWEERVTRFVRAPRRVINLDFERRTEPKPEPTTDPDKKETP